MPRTLFHVVEGHDKNASARIASSLVPQDSACFVEDWKADSAPTKSLVLTDYRKVFGIALLTDVTADESKMLAKIGVRDVKWLLKYVYVLPDQRKKGCATKILEHIRNSGERTAAFLTRASAESGCWARGGFVPSIMGDSVVVN